MSHSGPVLNDLWTGTGPRTTGLETLLCCISVSVQTTSGRVEVDLQMCHLSVGAVRGAESNHMK